MLQGYHVENHGECEPRTISAVPSAVRLTSMRMDRLYGTQNSEGPGDRATGNSVKGGDILDNRGGGKVYHQGLSAQRKCPL